MSEQKDSPAFTVMEQGLNAFRRLSLFSHLSKTEDPIENGHRRTSKRMSLSLMGDGAMMGNTNTKRGSASGQILFKSDSRRPVARLVNKDGSYHVEHVHPAHGLIRNFRNTFPFLLEIKWRWIILGIGLCYPVSWIGFALLYYAIAHANGDFDSTVLNAEDSVNGSETAHSPCMGNVNGFEDVFLFSVESQMTVGYGYRYPSAKCPVLWTIVCGQYVVGAVLQGCICGIIWARLLRPKQRGQEVVFSVNAVINQIKNGRLCLMFRLSDIAGNNLINASIRVFMAEKRNAWLSDDDLFSFRLSQLTLEQEEMLLLWPSIVSHVIDENSPLYDYSKADMERASFELIVTVGGVVASTGLTVETRTSYLANEILWGRRFQPMNFIGLHKSKVKVDYLEFDNTYYVETPTVSARKLEELLKGADRNGS